MGRIIVPVPVDRKLQPPGLPLGIELNQPQVVDIASGAVLQFSKETVLRHVQDSHVIGIVIGLFQHRIILAVLLGRLYQFPALVYRESRRHFRAPMLTCAHSRDTHGRVILPGRGRYD